MARNRWFARVRLLLGNKLLHASLFTVAILAGGYYLYTSDVFVVRHIQLVNATSDNLVQHDLIEGIVAQNLGEFIFSVNEADVELQIVQELVPIDWVHIQKEFPDTLIVNYQEHHPVVVLKKSDESRFFVGHSGLIFSPVPEQYAGKIPEVQVQDFVFGDDENDIVGSSIEFETIQDFVSISEYNWTLLHLTLNSINYSGDGFVLDLGQFEAKLSTIKNVARQLSDLDAIVKQARLDGRQIQSIDLRFDRPVVRYS